MSFAEYDWTRNIVGDIDGVEVILLRDSGIDIHSYQPTANDLMCISSAELLIYISSPSFSGFDDEIAAMAKNKLDLLEGSGIEKHDHSHNHAKEHDHTEDEHIWLSLSHAVSCCEKIAQKLIELDPDNAQGYEDNLQGYINELNEIDSEYRDTILESEKDTLVFADRYPFSHMTEDYSLNCIAPFSGCGNESEASFEHIVQLITAVDENDLDYVIVLEGSDQRIARTVISSTEKKNQSVLALNSMQKLGRKDIYGGLTYISIMRENLKVLKTALN